MMKSMLSLMSLALLLAACSPTAMPASKPSETAVTSQTPVLDCRLVNMRPTPGPDVPSVFPPVSEDDHTIGPANAAVTIIEYGDFQ